MSMKCTCISKFKCTMYGPPITILALVDHGPFVCTRHITILSLLKHQTPRL